MNTGNVRLEIRQALEQDILLLSEIGRTTFLDAFAEDNNPEDMAEYVNSHFSIDNISKEFRDEQGRFFIATFGGEIAAYTKIKVGSAEKGLDPVHTMEIERFYVVKAFQGRKIGKELMAYVLNEARLEDITTIWLGVWEHNLKAIEFYRNNGFGIFGSHVFMLGTDAQNDLLMKKEL